VRGIDDYPVNPGAAGTGAAVVAGPPPVPAGSTEHPDGRTIWSVIKVTSPPAPAAFAASRRPGTVAPAPRVMDADAMIVPTNVVPLIVAELPTVQKTLHASWAALTPGGRFVNPTLLPVEVMRSQEA
jgi:hypothetical protein